MMVCGCAAQGTCSALGGQVFDPPIPACIVHDCIEVAASPPDLTGRRARCDYFGPHHTRPRSFECNYAKQTGCTREQCRCELPSATTLPFFMYCGPGSVTPKDFDRFFCGCRGWD